MSRDSIKSLVKSIIPHRHCVALFCASAVNVDDGPQNHDAWCVKKALTADFLLAHNDDHHLALMESVAIDRLARGDEAWTFWHGEILVHVAWVRHDSLLDLQYELGEGCSWLLPCPGVVIYDCYTPFASRGKGCYVWALTWLLKHYSGHCWIYSDIRNKPSLKGILQAGFHLHAQLSRWYFVGRHRGRCPVLPSQTTHGGPL